MNSRKWIAASIAVVAMSALAGCSGQSDGDGGGGGDATGGDLTMLIGSSGESETEAVQAAADAWADENGATVEVVAASDLAQQLSQGFAGDDAPDVFYMAWDQFATYAGNDYLEAYAADLPNADDFYPSLVDTFTFDDTFVCDPKDFSTLGLIINTDLWAAAGLTDADIPTDWDSLEAAATALTNADVAGLSFGPEYARVGVFMNQAGGTLVDGDTVTADSPENQAGLDYVSQLHDAGVLKFPAEIDAGWSGEALGAGKAAMVIEGPWIKGIETDFPDTNYAAYELPAGPAGDSTFTFTNCWGIPQGSDTRDQAVSLIEFLTSDEQQLAFADAFGVIPSTESAAATYADTYPENAAFVAGADYAVSPVNFAGSADVFADFNAQLAGLLTGAPTAPMLESLQTELQAALDDANAQ